MQIPSIYEKFWINYQPDRCSELRKGTLLLTVWFTLCSGKQSFSSFFEMITVRWKKYDSIISLFPSWDELISLPKIDCLGQKHEVIILYHTDSTGIMKRNFNCRIICLPIHLNTRYYH